MRYHKKFETDSIWSVLKPMSVVGNPVTSVEWRHDRVIKTGRKAKPCVPGLGPLTSLSSYQTLI